MYQIRLDERKVGDEMLRILENRRENETKIELANELLHHLEANYNSRIWLVIVLDEGRSSHINLDHSSGFHTANSTGIFAVAISVDKIDPPDFSGSANVLLNDFRFPIETVSEAPFSTGLSLKCKNQAQDFHLIFQKFLIPLWDDGQFGVESVAITTPCSMADRKMNDYVSVSASSVFKWKRIKNQDECANKQIIVIPSSRFGESKMLNSDGMNQMSSLRNELGRVYLSAKEVSEGAVIDSELEFKNSPSQRWRFVNNQLVNGNGKCLTAWTKRSWYLYQYDCHPDWAGQIWIRHGLQIVNGFRLCLAFENSDVVQNHCDSTSQFLWYTNWETYNKDASNESKT